MREIVAEALREHRDELRGICRKIHDNPELGFEERDAAQWQVELTRSWGFNVETPFGGLETAYKASAGRDGDTFCFMAEYDALPKLGHACGHNLIATCALAAGLALKRLLEKRRAKGRVIIMGTPAEEGKGGKVIMIRNNAFNGIDAAMMGHPFYRTITDPGYLANARFDVAFRGVPSHASVSPEKGKNALDAVMLLFQGVNAWRQQLPEVTRVHGNITDGGEAPNIIPGRAACCVTLRANEDKVLREMRRRFLKMIEGAALMTETVPDIKEKENPYRAGLINAPLNEAFYELASDLGLNPSRPSRGGRASTDFANVSQILPCAHIFFGIAEEQKIALHSPAFVEIAGSDAAFDKTLLTAEALALTGFRYLTVPTFKQNVNNDFIAKEFDYAADYREFMNTQ